jgi:hypothetical protein
LSKKVEGWKVDMDKKFNKIYSKLDSIGIQEHSKFRETDGN